MRERVRTKFCSKSSLAVVLVLAVTISTVCVKANDGLISNASVFVPQSSVNSFFAPSDDVSKLIFTNPKFEELPKKKEEKKLLPSLDEILSDESSIDQYIEAQKEVISDKNNIDNTPVISTEEVSGTQDFEAEDSSIEKKIVQIEDNTESVSQETLQEFQVLKQDDEIVSSDDAVKNHVAESDNKAEPEVLVQNDLTEIVDLEGKTISNITLNGVHSINPDDILVNAKTQVGNLYRQDILQDDLQKIYSTGYFTDDMNVEPILNKDGTVDLIFNLKENILINQVNILGNTVVEEKELMPFVNSLKGRPENLNEINLAIQKITNYYHEKGFVLASISSVDDTNCGTLSFTVLEGVINDIKISGNERTKDFVIKRNIMTKAGTVYNEEYLKKDLSKIYSTQVFDEVNREIIPSEEQPGSYDIEIIVKEKVTNSVGFGGGIDTGMGAFGSINFKEDNFLGRGQRVGLSGILGSGILLSDASIKNHMNYQAELSFFEPYFINADNSLMAKLYFREMGSWNVPLAIEQRFGLRAGVEHKVAGNEKLTTSFSAGIEHINLKEGDANRISELFAKHNLNMSERSKQLAGGFFIHLTPGIKYNSVDNIENPRNGILAQAQFNEAIGIENLKHTNGRISGAVTKFFPVREKSSFSITAKAGAKIHGKDMPEVMAYRLGGPYTIRGYRMNGVGSGDSFVMGSAELATPLPFVDRLKWDIIKKMRLTFFVDAGEVFDPTFSNVLYDRPLHAITAGVGLRLYIPGVGPISVDYGLPITNPGAYGSRGGYFTFGTGGLNGIYGY